MFSRYEPGYGNLTPGKEQLINGMTITQKILAEHAGKKWWKRAN